MESPVILLRKFFSANGQEISFPEFTSWYKTLSDQEREEFKTLVSLWDGKSEFIPFGVQASHTTTAVAA